MNIPESPTMCGLSVPPAILSPSPCVSVSYIIMYACRRMRGGITLSMIIVSSRIFYHKQVKFHIKQS